MPRDLRGNALIPAPAIRKKADLLNLNENSKLTGSQKVTWRYRGFSPKGPIVACKRLFAVSSKLKAGKNGQID